MSEARTRVLVLYGGRSSEHSISCVSAGSVLAAMDRARFDPICVGITPSGSWLLQDPDPGELVIRNGVLPTVDPTGDPVTLSLDPDRHGLWVERQTGARPWFPIDVVFPVLHGPHGEDGTVQGLFDVASLPYVGSGVLASAACMHKATTKRLLQAAGIPAGSWHSFTRGQWPGPHVDVVRGLGWPLFVKPARAGSSMGVSKVADMDALHAAVDRAAEHDQHLIVEAGVQSAREIECGVLQGSGDNPRASVCAEIKVRSGHEFYDFEAKYLDDSVDLIVPAEIPVDLADRIREVAVRAFQALDCRGLARVDFFVDSAGEVMVNEINTMPGFTSISMYPRMWQASGVTYQDLIATLLDEALHRRG